LTLRSDLRSAPFPGGSHPKTASLSSGSVTLLLFIIESTLIEAFNCGYDTPDYTMRQVSDALRGYKPLKTVALFYVSDNIFIHLDTSSQTFQAPHFLLFEDLGHSMEFNSLNLGMVLLKVLIQHDLNAVP